MRLKISVLFLGLFLCLGYAGAQTLPVGLLDNTDDYLRRQQLIGNDSTNSSFMIRPIHQPKGLDLNKTLYSNQKGSVAFYALPVVLQQQYNTDHPYGMNDGAMIPARGYQTLFSAGVAAKIGPLSIQLRPEYVFAENRDFRGILEADNSAEIKRFYKDISNRIDLPERFGNGNYSKLNWGQSSIRLNAGPISFGLSNENLWWGPGIRNSLLMTNNAPGFKYFTLNTLRPIKTIIGSFEAQVIGGKLESSGITPQFAGYKLKPGDWRYISGVTISYQPTWIPGLFLGLDRSFIVYHENMGSGFSDYFPIFSGVTKDNYSVEDSGPDSEDLKARDQLISVFARWILPENNAEIYFQYGREDHSKDIRDFIIEPEHDKAYVAGFRKLVKLQTDNRFLQIGLELTKLEGSATRAIRSDTYWYVHIPVRDGYTQQGQILGVGLDPGSNLQTLYIGLVNGWNKIGVQLERYAHNNTLYDKELSINKGKRNPWIDFGFTAKYDKEFKGLIFNSQVSYINSSNYQWVLPELGKTFANNIQLRIGVLYRW